MTEPAAVSLETVLNALPFGLSIVDQHRRIVLMNPAFYQSLDLPSDAFPPGSPVEDAVRASALRGVYGPGDPEAQVRSVMAVNRGKPGRLRRRTFGGRSFDLYNTPLPDGGYIVSAMETTALLAACADAEGALARTATALTTLRIGLAIFDPQRGLLLANPRFAALLALPPDRLVGGCTFEQMLSLMQTREEFASPEGADFIASLRELRQPVSWSARRRRADGRSLDILLDPLPDGGFAVTVTDITPQAQAEDDASRRARLLDLVLLNVPHGICVYGPDHRVTMFNDTYNKVMQGAPLRVGDGLDDIIRRRAEAGEYGPGETQAVVATQLGYNIARPQMRHRIRPNGTAIDIRTAPLPDGGHISVVTDITALTQAEAELRQRAEDMSTMLGSIRHGIMLWGADKRLRASNPVAADLLDLPATLLTPGRGEAELIGALADLSSLGSDEAPAMARLLLDLDRSVPSGREMAIGSGRTLFVQSTPTAGGGWVSTFTDITRMRETESELRRAKELAEAANDAKSRFLATMSHELRTPLNAIIGFSDALVRDDKRGPADLVAEYSSQINDAGRQLLSLINIILDVARIETGRFEPDENVVDIAAGISAAVQQVEQAAKARQVTVELRLVVDLPQLRGDQSRIVEALAQLLSNAIKFAKPGGLVTVKAGFTPEAEVFVSISDSGIGIPDHDLERVFEPFTQLDDSLSRRYPGAGLGLFIARAIVAAHGGQLLLTSRPGDGTTARVILPRTRLFNGSAP